MRLTSLVLERYGNYEAEKIRFDPRPNVVNLLWAPNSAGKSVLRNAVIDLLFGIHDRTKMDFRFGYRGMRVTAEIVRSDGSEVAFSRRKARINAITGEDGQGLDPGFLHFILGGRDRPLLERLFVLDTDALRAGGRALLESGGDVASALLSAAGGIRQARALKQKLERQRDDLAPQRKTASRKFYQAQDRFLQARARGRAETLRPDEWFRQQRELEALDELRRARNEEAEAAAAEVARLERIRRVRPWLAQLADAGSWLERNPEAPRLDGGLRQLLDQAQLDLRAKQEAARIAAENLARAEQGAEDVILDQNLLGRAEDIGALRQDASVARNASSDLPEVRRQYDMGLARMESLLRQIGSGLSAARVADILPARPLVVRARKRISEYAEREAAVRSAAARIDARQRELSDLRAALETLPDAPETQGLELLLTEIRSGGDPIQTISAARKAVQAADAELAAALGRVPGWKGRAEELVALAPPVFDLWQRIDREMAGARHEADAASEKCEDDIEALREAHSAENSLSPGEPVPDDDALASARSHRDTGWQLIYRRAFTSDLPPVDEETAFSQGVPLPLAFERAIGEADRIADRRAAGSGLLARIEAARLNVTEAKRRFAAAQDRHRVAQEKYSQVARVWAQLCRPLGVGEDASAAEVQAFLNARDRVIDALAHRTVAMAGLVDLQQRHDAWSARLAASLGMPATGLAELLVRADRLAAAAAHGRQQRNEIETKLIQAQKEVRDAQQAQDVAKQALGSWRTEWQAVLAELGRMADEAPEETESALLTFNDLEKEHRGTVSLADRIASMTACIERFNAATQEVARSLPFVTWPVDAFETVREMDRLLTAERAKQERQRTLQEGLSKALTDAAASTQALKAAQARLRAVLELIGAETIAAAQQRLDLADARARQEFLRDAAEAKLREAGDGLSIPALRQEAAGSPADEDVARRDAAGAARLAASEAAQLAAEQASALRQTMEREANDTSVNDAAADQQAAIATLSSTLEEALLYHAASLLLGRALQEVEKAGDSALSRRLSAIFQTLTGGAYDRVVTEQDDDGTARLVLVQRDFPEERQSIDQLSEGTRDQFFLALRVAAIEDHLNTAEPLPFIGDDILQTFDDERALAALRVLTELSQRTQVIVMTHHRHVLDLASRLPERTVFHCTREPVVTPAYASD